MTHSLAIVKAIGVTKNRDRDVVSQRIDNGTRRLSFFLNFLPKPLGNVGRFMVAEHFHYMPTVRT